MSNGLNVLGDRQEGQRFDPGLSGRLIRDFGKNYVPPKQPEAALEPGAEKPRDASTRAIPIGTGKDIYRSDYIWVPGIKGPNGENIGVSKFEIAGSNNMNYEDTHKFMLENGLAIPTSAIFMPHFVNVVDTHFYSQPLLDGNGIPIPKVEHKHIYQHLVTNHIAAFGVGEAGGAWTWLNGRFVKGKGFCGLDLETVVGLKEDGTLKINSEPLVEHVWIDDKVYVDAGFWFNPQGLPTSFEGYDLPRGIKFSYPSENMVARFEATKGEFELNCSINPNESSSSLGAFAVVSLGTDDIIQNPGGQS